MLSFTRSANKAKDVEAQNLYHSVVPLELGDIRRASSTSHDAFLEDPMHIYLRSVVIADDKPSPTLTKAVFAFFLAQWRRTKVVLTIDAGAAVVVATPPDGPVARPIDKLAEYLITFFLAIVRKTKSRELRKRQKEATDKIKAAVSATLGDRVDSMIYVDLLVTEPQSQGHGYGGALLEAIASISDIAGQAAWLQSSNVNNTEFYISHGFMTVGQATLGDDNPEWQGKPIIIPIMVREPRKRSSIEKLPSKLSERRLA